MTKRLERLMQAEASEWWSTATRDDIWQWIHWAFRAHGTPNTWPYWKQIPESLRNKLVDAYAAWRLKELVDWHRATYLPEKPAPKRKAKR